MSALHFTMDFSGFSEANEWQDVALGCIDLLDKWGRFRCKCLGVCLGVLM